jgi:NAD(P)-dependent dehydrogenase (short-subunit alcohol dehydrogenase family)
VAAIEEAFLAFGAFDGLYHVAGGSGRKFGDGPLHELTDAGLRSTLDLNLSSLIYSNRAAVRWWLERHTHGCILNMGSVLGSSPSPNYFATHGYAAAKAAVAGFSVSIASCYAKHGIRVNVLAPALVETPMAQRAVKDDEIVAFVRTKQPLAGGRVGMPADCDGAAVFLLSDAASYITGQVLAVDGGWSVSEGQLAPPIGQTPCAGRVGPACPPAAR